MCFFSRNRDYSVSAALQCHIGRRRLNNEDNFSFAGRFMPKEEANRGCTAAGNFNASDRPVFAVCDGMCGEKNGENASYLAVSAISNVNGKKNLDWEILLSDISQIIFDDLPDAVQGCTVALVACEKKGFRCINVGDSRIYLFRHGRLTQISRDHSPVFDLFLSGAITKEEARLHPHANIISRYLGMASKALPHPFTSQAFIPHRRGDSFLICSDGLTDLVPDTQIKACLEQSTSAAYAAKSLLDMALQEGGRDNITIMVLKADEYRP